MPINLQGSSKKLMCSDHSIRKMYCENHVIYSSGSTVTYCVDAGVSYKEEVDEGDSVLSPKTFTPAKSGWSFIGWRSDKTASGSVLSAKTMGDDPITLYAVFRRAVTVTYYNASSAASSTTGYRYYNNGNVVNPSFALSQTALSGWTARGWSTGSGATSGITYSNGAAFTRDSNITLYGMYYQTITLSYYGNGATSGSVAAQYGTRYYCPGSGSVVNPTFVLNANGFARTNYNFSAWALNSAGGTQYAVGASITLATSSYMYAVWVVAKTPYSVISGGVCHISPGWKLVSASNGRVGIGDTKVNMTTDSVTSGSSFTVVSDSLQTKGCDTLKITASVDDSNYITVNGQSSLYSGFADSHTFSVSGKSSVTITATASKGAYGGSPSVEFYEISFS